MPILDGYQATKQIRKHIEDKNIKKCFIVACSADVTE